MNSIPQLQNEPRQVDLLLAQRRLYSKAKVFFALRTTLALVLAVVGPIISGIAPRLGPYVGAVALTCLVINLIFEGFESKSKANAATIQELFDTSLFELPWNQFATGKRPDEETIAMALNGTSKDDFKDLRDWYAIEVGKVDLKLATLLCQRINVWWDSDLRRLYVRLLLILLGTLVLVALFLGLLGDFTVSKLLVGFIFPLLPLAEVLIAQIKQNCEAANVTSELKENLDAEIEKWMRREQIQDSSATARIIQDQIWRHRSKCPMIFDWVHRLYKPRHENLMQFSAKVKVEEYLNHG
jgi:hypothetical protein